MTAILAFLRALLAPLTGLWLHWQGRRTARTEAALEAATGDLAAHERINDADLGIGASDGERVKRLREFADRHGG